MSDADALYERAKESLLTTGTVVEGATREMFSEGITDEPAHEAVEDAFAEVERFHDVAKGQIDQAFRDLAALHSALGEYDTLTELIEATNSGWWVFPEALARAFAALNREGPEG